VLRNIGTPIAHTLIALRATLAGLDKLVLNEEKIHNDLENNWMVVAEALQTVLRRENFPKPYEALKELTRTHERVTKETIHHFIDGLAVSEAVKQELKAISPWTYLGIQLVD
jgi:adenylosuccinate lyase